MFSCKYVAVPCLDQLKQLEPMEEGVLGAAKRNILKTTPSTLALHAFHDPCLSWKKFSQEVFSNSATF